MPTARIGATHRVCLIVKLIFEKNNFVMRLSVNHSQKVQWESAPASLIYYQKETEDHKE